MGSLNKVMLVGRLGKDPEIRHTAAGMAVCAMSIATDSKWTNKAGEKQEKTEWHRVKAWAKLGEVCGQYLAKGSLVYIEGRLETTEYTDAQGVKKFSTEVVASEMQFLSPKSDGAGRGASVPAGVGRGSEPLAQEDIPF